MGSRYRAAGYEYFVFAFGKDLGEAHSILRSSAENMHIGDHKKEVLVTTWPYSSRKDATRTFRALLLFEKISCGLIYFPSYL